MTNGIQLNAWYTLSKADGPRRPGVDELTTNLVQDSTNPLPDVQLGPARRTDARHKVTLSAVIQAPWGITVSPVFRYRSALPMHIWYGYDNNLDGVSNDIYPTAYRFKGVDDAGNPTFEEMGACETINCGRGAPLSQFNLRVAKSIPIRGTAARRGVRRSVQPVQRDQPGVQHVGAASSVGVLHRHAGEPHAEHGVHEAARVCRRQRSARAARRPDRVPVRVLIGGPAVGSRGRRSVVCLAAGSSDPAVFFVRTIAKAIAAPISPTIAGVIPNNPAAPFDDCTSATRTTPAAAAASAERDEARRS